MRTTLGCLALFLALVSTSLNGQQLIASSITGSATIAALPDSTLKLGTRVVITGFIAGDTVRYNYYKNDTTVLISRRTILKDSTTVPAPTYGVSAVYKGCAQVERGGRLSGIKYPTTPLCWVWNYTRTPPVGSIDSIFQLTIRPLGPELSADSGARCLNWQAANTDKSVWVVVNEQAVPACMSSSGKLIVWQYCIFGKTVDGRKVKMQNSWNDPYCEQQYQSFLSEVSG